MTMTFKLCPNPINSEASSDNKLDQTNLNDNMLNNLLKGITNADETINDINGNHDDNQEGDTAKKQYENELYQLLLGTEFKMKIKNVESKVYNCSLSWWKSSAGRHMNLGKLVIKYLAVPLSASGVDARSSFTTSASTRVLALVVKELLAKV